MSDFWTRFWIFRATDSVIVYRDSVFTGRLNVGVEDTLFFTPFTCTIPRGNYVVKCSTMLFNDGFPRNDAKQLILPLIIHDVGIMGIVNPPLNVYLGDSIVPQVWVKNYGTVPESFWTMLRITPAYHESSYVINLPTSPAESTQRLISFPVWVAEPLGTQIVTCSIPRYGAVGRRTTNVNPVALPDYKDNLKEKEITAVPNPFNNEISFSYTKAYKGPTFLAIYNLEGRIIRTLVKQQQEAGRYIIYWDGKDSEFRDIPAGIYFILWQSGEKTTIKKIINK